MRNQIEKTFIELSNGTLINYYQVTCYYNIFFNNLRHNPPQSERPFSAVLPNQYP